MQLTDHVIYLMTVQVKNRTKRLSELFKSYQPYDDQVGQRQSVLVTDISHDKNYYVGHNKEYVQVNKCQLIILIDDWLFYSFMDQGASPDGAKLHGENGRGSHNFCQQVFVNERTSD